MTKVGILGSGQVAQSLGDGFVKNNYKVMLGTRDESKLRSWKAKSGASVGSVEDAAKFGEIIVLATKGTAAEEVVRKVKDHLKGKLVIDTTNPISDEKPQNGVLKFFTSLNESLMESLQTEFPKIHFVKAFNSVGHAFMVNPDFGMKPTMFICGNNDMAKKEVSEILELFGWEVADMGKAEAARAIEPLCMLWCIPGFLNNQWNHAFKLLK